MKILADVNIPYLKGVFDPFVDIEYMEGDQIQNDHLKDVEVLIVRTRTSCNKELLTGSAVKFIATATIGYDHIDTHYCAHNDIKWVSAPGCNSKAVQQWVMASILYYARTNSLNLKNRVLGVIGIGNVGEKVVDFAEAIGLPVILNDPPRENLEGSCVFRSLDTVVNECDILTFHVPLTTSGPYPTHHMVNSSMLSALQEKSLLLNSSRGEVVNCNALKSALKNNAIKSAILDVWEQEPYPDRELVDLSFLATPHIAGYSKEGKANGTAAVVEAVAKYLDLPLEGWYPEEISGKKNSVLRIDCNGLDVVGALTEVVLTNYPIFNDSTSLKNSPENFENLRKKYRYRDEPQCWSVELSNSSREIKDALIRIGYEVKEV